MSNSPVRCDEKICRSCAHSRSNFSAIYMLCAHPEAPRDVVTGAYPFCSGMRSRHVPNKYCGLDGEWFEAIKAAPDRAQQLKNHIAKAQ